MQFCYTTTVDQHVGNHPTGLRETKFVEVVTQYSDYANDGRGIDDLSPADQRWWSDTLADIHAARVDLASLDADHRQAATEEFAQWSGDLEDQAKAIRAAIEETKSASRAAWPAATNRW